MPYLESVLTSNPTPFTITEVSEQKTSKNGKAYYTCEFKLNSTGETVSGNIYEAGFPIIGIYKPSDLMNARMLIHKEGRFPVFKLDQTTGDQPIPPSGMSNYEEVKREGKVSNKIDIHDWKLGLAGMLQSYRAGGDFSIEAREKATDDAKWIREKAEQLSQQ